MSLSVIPSVSVSRSLIMKLSAESEMIMSVTKTMSE